MLDMLPLEDLPTRREIEMLADAFGRRLPHSAPPIDVEALAGIAGIVDITYSDDISGSALLIGGAVEGFHAIVLKRSESKLRHRFSIAHEIGHRVIHPDRTAHEYREAIAARSGRAPVERACDYFAATLLMPRTLVNAWVPGSSCASLARAFMVSIPAMRSRLKELGFNSLATS